MTLEFLSPVVDRAPVAASPLDPWLEAAGARFEERDGWRVAMDLGAPREETDACRDGVGIADRSAMGKLELSGRPNALTAILDGLLVEDAVLWRSSPDRALAVCEPGATSSVRTRLQEACDASPGCGLVDLTAGLAAFELRGPLARAVLERLTAIDVRPQSLAPGGVRPGQVARVPAALFRLEPQAFLILVGAPEAPDAWEIALDAGAPLGLRPVGEEARARA
jgi:sarcosine oxidase subunit alpha